jgi:hypothetical protein
MSWVLLIAALAGASTETESEQSDTAADAGQVDVLPAPPTETGGVLRVDGLSTKQYRWLKPRRHLMTPNPYQQVDFTAYTLEWGETRLGVAGVQFGLFPRVQVGTQPVLDLLGIYNGTVKVNAFRAGPFDLGLTAAYHRFPLGDFVGQYGAVGGTMSWVLTPAWSIHGGVQAGRLQVQGLPTAPPKVFQAYVNQKTIEDWAAQANAVGVDPFMRVEGVAVRAATEVRLNRRDSFVIQGQAFTWGAVQANLGENMPDYAKESVELVLPGLSATSFESSKKFALSETYVLTLSYQASFRRIDLRIGGGKSGNALATALQANDLAVRFGGPTRASERKSKRGWRRNRDDVAR